MDFTIEKYKQLLAALSKHKDHVIRHDVDVSTRAALRLARVEEEFGVKSIYYFRSKHFTSRKHQGDIGEIARMGHRIGYHYENLAAQHGDTEKAYDDFIRNMHVLNKIAPADTACAHGSPWSKWDSQTIWEHHDLRSAGIAYEPMLDTDFGHTLYLTDTGRRWDGHKVSIRDKVEPMQNTWNQSGLSFHSTDDLIGALRQPDHPIHRLALLINAHPERWNPMGPAWIWNVIMQSCKNAIKGAVVYLRGRKKG